VRGCSPTSKPQPSSRCIRGLFRFQASRNGAGPTPQWIYQFLPGSRPELATEPDAGTESDERVAGAHFAYLQGALANQTLVMAGRSQDGIGPAIVIFEASDEDAARAFMEADPFISSGLFGASLHPYRVALARTPE